MSNKRSDTAILDHAYGDGKLVGFLGLETSAACPFGSDQTGPRIAWLDGFADGAWRGRAKIDPLEHQAESGEAWSEASDRPDLDVANSAIAHLVRLSKAVGARKEQSREVDAALNAATKFLLFVRLTGAARQDWAEPARSGRVMDKKTSQERLGVTVVKIG